MANVQAGDRFKAPYAGEVGNKGQWDGYHKMAAAGNVGDTIELCEVPAGVKLNEHNTSWSAHGGTATLSIGWKYKDGSAGGSATAIKAAASSVSAGNAVGGFLPITTTKPIIIYATNAASAIPQNGEVYCAVSGEFVDGTTGKRYPFLGTVPVVPAKPSAPAATSAPAAAGASR